MKENERKKLQTFQQIKQSYLSQLKAKGLLGVGNAQRRCESGARICADTWASGAQRQPPSYPRGSGPGRISHPLAHSYAPSSDNSGMWPPHTTAETALESLREEEGKGHTSGRNGCSQPASRSATHKAEGSLQHTPSPRGHLPGKPAFPSTCAAATPVPTWG